MIVGLGWAVVPFHPTDVHAPTINAQPVREIETLVACALGIEGNKFAAKGWIPMPSDRTMASATTKYPIRAMVTCYEDRIITVSDICHG